MPAARNNNNVLRFKRGHQNQVADLHADHECGNCGTKIHGQFCHVCGQSAHVHHSLLHLIEEMVHGLWHFDAKGWRTIPMLIAYPGELTRRYIDGQRVRFIAPLGLFLFMVFFMFFVFSFAKSDDVKFADKAAVAQTTLIAAARSDVDKAQSKLDAAKKSGVDIADRQAELDAALEDQKAIDTTLAGAAKLTTGVAASNHGEFKLDDNVTIAGHKGKEIKQLIRHALDNKELVAYKMKNNAYKFALLLVPLSLPFLWVMFFWRKQITMFDHAVFSLYSLSFMAFFAALLSVLFELNVPAMAMLLGMIVPPIHMYRQLKGCYQLSRMETLWRTAVLVLCACLMVSIFFLFVAALSFT
jgi:hypothetical protein